MLTWVLQAMLYKLYDINYNILFVNFIYEVNFFVSWRSNVYNTSVYDMTFTNQVLTKNLTSKHINISDSIKIIS